MSWPPNTPMDGPGGDLKRIQQRADLFATGSGQRSAQDREEIDDFEELLGRAQKVPEPQSFDRELADQQQGRLQEHESRHGRLEAERRGSSSGAPHLFPGLPFLPGVVPNELTLREAPQSEAKSRSRGVEQSREQEDPTFSAQILASLREAGLSSPIASLSDPRLQGQSDRLRDDFVLSLQENGRVYVWSRAQSHQIVSIGLTETKIESAAGSTVEILRSSGGRKEKTVRSRTPDSESFPDV